MSPITSSLAHWSLGGGLTLGQVAVSDPRLAFALLPQSPTGGDVSLSDVLSAAADQCGGCPLPWRILPICSSFLSASSCAPPAGAGITEGTCKVEASSDAILRDLWIRKITYTVRRPLAFANSIFKAQSDHSNKLNPNIDFTFRVQSTFGDFVFTADPTPIETIEDVFECVCPIGFVIPALAVIKAEFFLRRDLAPDEIPTEVCIVLHGVQLARRYNVELALAVTTLAARGVDCGGC